MSFDMNAAELSQDRAVDTLEQVRLYAERLKLTSTREAQMIGADVTQILNSDVPEVMPVDQRQEPTTEALAARSFSVEHAIGEKRRVVFLDAAKAEVERVSQQLAGAVDALEKIGEPSGGIPMAAALAQVVAKSALDQMRGQ